MKQCAETQAVQPLRTDQVRRINERDVSFTQYGPGLFKIGSASDPDRYYDVQRTGDGLVCECDDHQNNRADCAHIQVALEKIRGLECYRNEPFRMMEKTAVRVCKHCKSGSLKKDGMRKTKRGDVQRFKCMECGKRFTANLGFEKMRYDPDTVTQALQMYHTGMSSQDIADHFEMTGVLTSHMTVFNWISKYGRMTSRYIDGITPRTRDRLMVRADEVWIKVMGRQCYLFASMDDDTRFWVTSDMVDNKFQHNTDNLFHMTKQQIGRNPTHFVTDGLPTYAKSSRRVFGDKTNHIAHIHLKGKRDRDNNNKMERLNGEIRDREKVFRGLKKMDSATLIGQRVYYNYAKKHSALGGLTPAEAAGIEVTGQNKWKTLIQNAALYGAQA